VNIPAIDIMRSERRWPTTAKLRKLLTRAISAAASEAGLAWPEAAELSCVFTNDAEMTKINGQWRSKNQPTNILSFPGSAMAPGMEAGPMIGDLVLAFETVEREAGEQGKTFDDHLTHLLVHGFLHLFGYDHVKSDEAARMEQIEIRILYQMGITNPYENIVPENCF
jgi:probable rRNA maturation factor